MLLPDFHNCVNDIWDNTIVYGYMGAGGVGTRQWDIWNSILGRNGVLMGAPRRL